MKKINMPLHYGYSNTRVKAMKANMLSKEKINEILQMKDLSEIIALLLKTDYQEDIEEFGGLNTNISLIDFALNKHIARIIKKLIKITPKEEKEIIEKLAIRWDLYNLKLIVYSKATDKNYDLIKEYIIESNKISKIIIKEALEQPTFNDTINELIKKTPYKKILETIKEMYKKSESMEEVENEIDRYFFEEFGKNAEIIKRYNVNAAKIIEMDVEIRNILMLIRSKKYNLSEEQLKQLLIPYGITNTKELMRIYENSNDLKELINNIKSFDLRDAFNKYEQKDKRLLIFEINMKNQLFRKINVLLAHEVLSIGTIIYFFYLKEREVLTLRTIINSKIYEIENKNVEEMIGW
ncbi:MAG: V-type ATPase subunit [Candidatus Micrarchaeia archaeon]